MTYVNKKGDKAKLIRAYEDGGKYVAVIEIDGKREKREWSSFISEFNSLAKETT